ncbi:Hypothetical protein Minf_1738 [Methylacidiphilum infernorum V4]|uniref:Uncharacterized protein n=1 Tax=Methylacidiphilum infernorum (isolate V4) TaxID=481448 RepID=B3DX83_METI4|nr:Hypothetical protein Minf_1738 [Methylacidiphilum infernorum V4]
MSSLHPIALSGVWSKIYLFFFPGKKDYRRKFFRWILRKELPCRRKSRDGLKGISIIF